MDLINSFPLQMYPAPEYFLQYVLFSPCYIEIKVSYILHFL